MAIFVNYRREDSQSITGRIDDHLRRAFGEEEVYRDIDSIPPGVDFVEHLNLSLAQCDVFVAVLGSRWITHRLGDADDFVRVELETALQRGIPVIPVLVEGAQLPSREQVPVSLIPLIRRQAIRIDSGSDFRSHTSRLIQAIQSIRAKTANAGTRRIERRGDSSSSSIVGHSSDDFSQHATGSTAGAQIDGVATPVSSLETRQELRDRPHDEDDNFLKGVHTMMLVIAIVALVVFLNYALLASHAQ